MGEQSCGLQEESKGELLGSQNIITQPDVNYPNSLNAKDGVVPLAKGLPNDTAFSVSSKGFGVATGLKIEICKGKEAARGKALVLKRERNPLSFL